MGKPKKKNPNKAFEKRRKKAVKPIALLALGEGAEKGPAYRAAQALARRSKGGKVLVIDFKAPDYALPRNMDSIQINAVAFLENVIPGSVKRISDDYLFHLIGLGKAGRTPERLRKALKANESVKVAKYTGRVNDAKAIPNAKANEVNYARQAMRALVPGGKFVLTAGEQTLESIWHALGKVGFEISIRKMPKSWVEKKGSPMAKIGLRKGRAIYRVVGTKPR